jgi:CheY-like chemotaxis protein
VRLAQVLSNLLVNAAKFTPPEAGVALGLRVDEGWVEACVQDEGIGIAPELLPRVFELFVQGGQGIDRQGGGLGLGLAIVRSLAQLHGGTVSAHSEGPGRGSRFVVRLPLTDSAVAPLPPPAEPVAGSGRILLVDDNADACETLAELLRLSGYEVRTAGDAPAALALMEGFAPRLALLDIGLPGTDGYELASLVRVQPGGSGLKLVALTGYGSDSDRARALAAGFDEHLVKPVAIDKLLDTLSRLL